MNPSENVSRNVYQHILKATNRRLEQAIPGSEGTFTRLSLLSLLNILFLLQGQWGSIGDYGTTQRAVRALVGDELLWADPQKPSLAPIELVQ
jgi:hypothetical protein